MRAIFASTGLIAGIVVGITLAAASGGSAAPLGGATIDQHWSIASDEVIAQDNLCTDNTGFTDGVIGTSDCSHYRAAVHLPDGTVVTHFSVIYEDSVEPAHGSFGFDASDLVTGDQTVELSFVSSGMPGKTTGDSVGGPAIIDNSLYHYTFGLVLQPGVTFYSAVITYSIPAGAANANGDVDCDGDLTTRDNQALLRHVLSQAALSQTEPCPDVGE